MLGRTIEPSTLGIHSLESYEPLIGRERIERILKKADKIRDLHIVHVSSTFYGGGVTEILTPLTLIMNTIGIETGWRMIQGTPAFFNITKKLHNALQGSAIHLSSEEIRLFEQITFENAIRLHVEDRDVIIVHDPQPLALISQFPERVSRWIWQCHVDLSEPHPQTWDYIRKFVLSRGHF
jgi:trehalose synthase